MAKILHVTVSNRVAKYSQRDGFIVCGNSDYEVEFNFDSEWDGLTVKTARFKYNGAAVDVVFSGDTVSVPKIRNTTALTVGVYAGDLKTTTPATIPAVKSILCEDGLPPDPEPDVYAQIMEMLNNDKDITPIDAKYTIEFGEMIGNGSFYFTRAYTDRPYYQIDTDDESVGHITLIRKGGDSGEYIGATLSGVEPTTTTLLIFYCTLPIITKEG